MPADNTDVCCDTRQQLCDTYDGGTSNDVNLCSVGIYHQNVCGINPKKEELDMYLNNRGVFKPIYVCITEHFLNSKNIPLFSLTNYKLIAHNSRTNMLRGGSLILGLNDCTYEPLSICAVLHKQEYFEICGVKDIDNNLNICCLYNNGKDMYFNDFMIQLEKLLTYFFNKKCIIGGDFNVDLLTDDTNKEQFLNLLKCYNFRPLVDSVTYICGGARSCLDNFLTNVLPEFVNTTIVDHNGLSDGHAGLLCTLSFPCKVTSKYKEKYIKVKRRIFSTRNNNDFRESVLAHNWHSYGINCFLKNFNKCFTGSFKKIQRKYKVNFDNQIRWVTKGIRTASKMKRFLMPVNKLTHDISLVKYKNIYIRIFRRTLKNARRLAAQSELQKCKNSTKTIWKIANRHRNKVTTKNRDKIELKVGDRTIVNKQEIVETFSEKFDFGSSPFSSDPYSDPDPDRATFSPYSNLATSIEDMTWTPITPFEVRSIVRKMERKKSNGYDEVPIVIIQDNLDILADPLSVLYNQCYNFGVFPEQLKIAKIVPILKKGSKNDPKNYRPISLLPVLAKILEKLMKVRLLRHLEGNNILNGRQFGYQKNKGTKDAVNTLIDDVVGFLNQRKKVAGLFLDLSSAFDTVNHMALAQKLELYGVRGKALQLFQSFFNNRRQFVEIEGVESGELLQYKSRLVQIKRGVPQGSILGPILFILFTNDLIKFIEDQFPGVKLVVFADDTNAIISAENILDLELKANQVALAFDYWFKSNDLIVNTSKTNALLFRTTPRNRECIDIRINNEVVPTVESVKFLGVHIDSYLNWKVEISKLGHKISSACYALRSLRDEVSINNLKMVYHALVESHIRYSIRFWGNSYEYNINRAFTLQKRAIRTMVGIPPWESCKPYFSKLSIFTVPCLYILDLLTAVTRCSSEYGEETESRRLGTRRKERRGVIAPKLDIVKHSPRYQSVKVFNSLPMCLKIEQDPIAFKKSLKHFLLENAFYHVDELVCM